LARQLEFRPRIRDLGDVSLALFPSGHLPSSRWRPVAWLAGVGLGGLLVGVVVDPAVFEGLPVDNPLASAGLDPSLLVGVFYLFDFRVILNGVTEVSWTIAETVAENVNEDPSPRRELGLTRGFSHCPDRRVEQPMDEHARGIASGKVGVPDELLAMILERCLHAYPEPCEVERLLLVRVARNHLTDVIVRHLWVVLGCVALHLSE
jgi:hypothetical protein